MIDLDQGDMPAGERITQRVVKAEVEASLRRIEDGRAGRTDADLLRALFDGFNSLVQVIGVEIELASGTDRGGRPCFYLMMLYPEELG